MHHRDVSLHFGREFFAVHELRLLGGDLAPWGSFPRHRRAAPVQGWLLVLVPAGRQTRCCLHLMPDGRHPLQQTALGRADTFYVSSSSREYKLGVNMEIWIRAYAVTVIYCFGNYT